MKPKYLYHGSPRKIRGDFFIPRAPPEIDPNNPENNQKAVYATSFKEQAIGMSICRGKGVTDASMGTGKKNGKFYIDYGSLYVGSADENGYRPFLNKEDSKDPNIQKWSAYQTDKEHIEEFILFLRNCGGFQVW